MASSFASSFASSLPPPPSNSNSSAPRLDLIGSSLSFSVSSPLVVHRVSISSSLKKSRVLPVTLASASSSESFSSCYDDFESSSRGDKKSVLADLIQEIEPLDVSFIQKDVPPTTLDAMKRTISGMLGLLPSDRFQVFIESLWEPLSKLLVSSIMTGYTLRNAEYRLFLERHFDVDEDTPGKQIQNNLEIMQFGDVDARKQFEETGTCETWENNQLSNLSTDVLDEMSPEVRQYILNLESHLSAMKKELHEVKRRSAALQMQQFVGEEKNDLLDYLRSLQPEKVAELSEPTCPEVKEIIHSVVHGLLATLSPKMHSKAPPQSENSSATPINPGSEDCPELVENGSLQFQALISLTRDYLARLLFWCMLLGHYLRGLEYRMELMEHLSLTRN